jgi:hypothetical protein
VQGMEKFNKIYIYISGDNGKTYTIKPDSWFNWF